MDGACPRRRNAVKRILLTGTALLTLIGAAVPANAAHKHATRYDEAPVQQERFGKGVRVDEVDRGSAAARAGLRPGDWLVGINGSPVNGSSDLDPFVKQGGGRPVTIVVERGGAHVRLRVAPQRGRLGITSTEFFFGRGESSPYVEPPVPPPDPPQPPPPPPPPQIQPN
jgi:membrane-associated protease RseP (regulator of RpoE activity)